MPESFPLNMAVADSSIYAKGSLLNYWYHGQLTRVEAEHTLTVSGRNCFLIRESRGVLILSLVHRRQLYHIKIEYGPGWYKLQGSSHKCFQELQDLVNCYHKTPISDNPKISLGIACEKTNVTGNGTGELSCANVDMKQSYCYVDVTVMTNLFNLHLYVFTILPAFNNNGGWGILLSGG